MGVRQQDSQDQPYVTWNTRLVSFPTHSDHPLTLVYCVKLVQKWVLHSHWLSNGNNNDVVNINKRRNVLSDKEACCNTNDTSVRNTLSVLRVYCFWMQQTCLSLDTFFHLLVFTTLLLLPCNSYCKCTFIFVPIFTRCTNVKLERVQKLASPALWITQSRSQLFHTPGGNHGVTRVWRVECRMSALPINGGGHRL